MYENEPHQMELERTHPSGAEEWHCPACGRRFLMQYPPSYKKIVLAPGDEHAAHYGGKGALSMGPAQVLPPGAEQAADEPAAGPAEHEEGADDSAPPAWLRWLDGYDPAAD